MSDDFETQLSGIPMRQIPPHWKSSILAKAESRKKTSIGELFVFARSLLWPHPAAWAALAVCWIATLTLNLSGPRGAELCTVTPKGVKPLEISAGQYAAYLRARDIFLTTIETPEPSPISVDSRKM